MKKTVTVNIGGFSFVINETAYEQLQSYLAKVELKLSGDSAEIMQDIESRIAELLKERMADSKEVVDESDIDYIQSVMGQPEDYEDDEAQDDTYQSYEQASSASTKSLYRDMDNAMLGGVCSGLGRYFNVDPLVMRIIFIFFAVFLGSGVLLYIILLIVIPEAKTTAEKLKMSGEAVNLESIKSHFNKLGTDLNDRIRSKQFSRKVNTATHKTVDAVSSVATVFGKIVGVIFTIGGIICLILLLLYLTGSQDIVPFTSIVVADSFSDFLNVIFPSSLFANMALYSLIIVVAIPLVTTIMTGIKLLFGIRYGVSKGFGIAAGIIFGVAFSFLCIALARTGVEFSNEGSSSRVIESSNFEQLIIETVDDNHTFFKMNSAYGCCDFMAITHDKIALKNVSLYVEEGLDSSTFSVKTMVWSQGMTDSKATTLANQVNYQVNLTENVLKIPSFLTVNKSDKFRAQRVKVVVRVPKGKSVKFSDNLETLNCYMNGNRRYKTKEYSSDELNNAVWYAEDGEMKCEQCWD